MPEPQNTPPLTAKIKEKRRARRKSPKNGTLPKAFRNALGLGPNIAVSILDLSESGVRLVLKEPLKVNAEFEVAIENVTGRRVKLIGRVVWSLELADGRFCVGVCFQKNLTYAEMDLFARN
jgi:hypothetical protein